MTESLSVGVVVLCAKNEERTRLLDVFKSKFQSLNDRHGTYDRFLIQTAGDEPNELLLISDCQDMGSTYSAARTGFVIGTQQPNLIIFVGTAGGLASDKLTVGDVFLPTGCVARYYDKVSERGTNEYKNVSNSIDFQEYFLPKKRFGFHLQQNVLSGRTKEQSLTEVASRQISRALSSGVLCEILKKLKNNNDSDKKPKIEQDGKIYSSDWVIDSESYRKFLMTKLDRKALAVDMESFGFLKTIDLFRSAENKVTNGIVIRGISDNASKKDSIFAPDLAMENASIVATEIILKGYLGG